MFASGDIGGARSLVPVITRCEEGGMDFVVVANGAIVREVSDNWPMALLDNGNTEQQRIKILVENEVGAFVFASSVHDQTALEMARTAKSLGIPVVHVLDNWTNYRNRLEMDGGAMLIPDLYTVMDALAFDSAVDEGIDKDIIRAVGQPALASLFSEWQACNLTEIEKVRESLGFDQNKKLLVFVSEPAESDQGGPGSESYRGYTEKDVLKVFCDGLQKDAKGLEVAILPHPREQEENVSECWQRCKGALSGRIIQPGNAREIVFLADGVAGMASLLLYEAWLLDKPVLSIQPDVRYESLRMLSKRQGVVFVDQAREVTASILKWLGCLQNHNKHGMTPDLDIHRQAPEKISKYINELLH